MIDRAWAEAFACNWIASWNAHDIEHVLARYAGEFEMTSPLVVQRFALAWLEARAAVNDSPKAFSPPRCCGSNFAT